MSQFNLLKIPEVISHLKKISNLYKQINDKEIQIFCPYCNDATRKHNPTHGHLYLSVHSPVFHCFRCNASGVLTKLLYDTGFDDIEILKYIHSFVNYRFSKDFLVGVRREVPKRLEFQRELQNQNQNFILSNYKEYTIIRKFIYEKIGFVTDYTKFNILPGIYTEYQTKKQHLVVYFVNDNLQHQLCRFLFPIKRRYKKFLPGKFSFQNNPTNYTSFTISEGPFDIINLFLYNPDFRNTFLYSINSKNYIKSAEDLIISEMLIGKFQLNIIFDPDIKYTYFIKKRILKIINRLNDNIELKCYVPTCPKLDVGDFSEVILI
jgi:hypothetical protein